MSDSEASGEEGSLCIDTKRAITDSSKKKTGNVKGGKGRKNAKKGKGQNQDLDGPPKPGDLVWAKVMGFNFWPAKLFDAAGDDMVPEWLKQPPKPSYLLVRFFGTYDMQWVSPSSVETYARGLKKRFQTKSKSKAFQKAMLEVTDYVEKSIIPEGLTVSPPYPQSEENGKRSGKRRREKRGNGQELDTSQEMTDGANDSIVTSQDKSDDADGAEENNKSVSPKPPASPSIEPAAKRPRLEDGEENKEEAEQDASRLVSPEVKAFTCAPLSAFSSSKEVDGESSAAQDAKSSDGVSDAPVKAPIEAPMETATGAPPVLSSTSSEQ